MIYIIIYQDGMQGVVHSAYRNKEKAKEIANKLNGDGIRYGTYEVHKAKLVKE